MRFYIKHHPDPVLPANRQFRPRGILMPHKRLLTPGDNDIASMRPPVVIA